MWCEMSALCYGACFRLMAFPALMLPRALIAQELFPRIWETVTLHSFRCRDSPHLGQTRVGVAQVMSAFHSSAEERVARLEAELAAAVAGFAQLAAYVNGSARSSVSDPQAFFTVLITFARDLDIAHAENTAADQRVRSAASHERMRY